MTIFALIIFIYSCFAMYNTLTILEQKWFNNSWGLYRITPVLRDIKVYDKDQEVMYWKLVTKKNPFSNKISKVIGTLTNRAKNNFNKQKLMKAVIRVSFYEFLRVKMYVSTKKYKHYNSWVVLTWLTIYFRIFPFT